MTGQQLYDLSAGWDLKTNAGTAIFCDWLEEHGYLGEANCLRAVRELNIARAKVNIEDCGVRRWLASIQPVSEAAMTWLCIWWIVLARNKGDMMRTEKELGVRRREWLALYNEKGKKDEDVGCVKSM